MRIAPERKVRLSESAATWMILTAVDKAFAGNGIITSALEGKHSPTSLHPKGLAYDFRTRHLSEGSKKALVDWLKEYLGESFDVILEKDHLHVEYDPS